MRICLIGHKIQIHSRASDTGLLWPLAKGLTEKGHEVTIISTTSPMKKAEVIRDGIRAYFLYDGPSGIRPAKLQDGIQKKFHSLHQEKPFDIVHSLDDSGYKIGRHKKNFDVTMAYDIQATHMPELFSILIENNGTLSSQIKTSTKLVYTFLKNYFLQDRSLLDSADGVFTTTPQQRNLLERYFLYPDYHTYTIPYGIQLGDLEEKIETDYAQIKLNLPQDAQIVLAFSNFTNSFEIKPLLKAFADVALKNMHTYLVILGDGPRWKEVEYLMLKLVLGSRVIMPKSQNIEDLSDFISSAKIYVDLSSHSTGLEPSLVEAMAQKKIVIGSELSPIAEIIEDSIDGFLVRPADHQHLQNLIHSVLNSPEQYKSLGEKARTKVLELFNRNKLIDSLQNSYFEIIKKAGKSIDASSKRTTN